jgi:murein tripeptide amidase MpaA
MYRTIAQLDLVTQQLAQSFPQQCTRIQLPEASVQGRPVHALRLRAGTGEGRRGVLLLGGVHARELMNPDMLVELAVDLVTSYRNGTDLVLGARVWPAQDIRVMLETLDVYILPCSNPDGRHYVMTVDDMWRKNRRVNQGTPCVGVDLNRNADLLWGVTEGQTSCAACAETFVGSAPFSEPESRNVRHMVDTYRIDCFVDVHSYSELVLYPWGHAQTQTTDPTKRFTTLATGTCKPLPDPSYREYMTPQDLQRFTTVAQRIVAAIADVRGRVYTAEPGKGLYGTTGTNSDYAYGRHISDGTKRKTYGYTFETGPWMGNAPDSFHPPNPEPIKREAESGALALIQQCICAIELIGTQVLGRRDEIDALRRVRDRVLATTEAGREWIRLLERVQGPAVRVITADESLVRMVADAIARAGQLAADDSNRLDREAIADILGLLGDIEERAASAEISAGAFAVRDVLEGAYEQTVGQFLAQLASRGPRLAGA